MLLAPIRSRRREVRRRSASSSILSARATAIIARRADDQPHFSRPGQRLPFGHACEGAVEITGQHRDIAAGHERADAAFEFLQFRLSSTAFLPGK